jgi:hypothetical protein
VLWQDLQEAFFIVFTPCLAGVVLPFFLAGLILIGGHRFIDGIIPRPWRRK